MPHVIGIYDREKLERIEAEGYEVLREGENTSVDAFFAGSEPLDDPTLVRAAVYIDADSEDFFQPFGTLTKNKEAPNQ